MRDGSILCDVLRLPRSCQRRAPDKWIAMIEQTRLYGMRIAGGSLCGNARLRWVGIVQEGRAQSVTSLPLPSSPPPSMPLIPACLRTGWHGPLSLLLHGMYSYNHFARTVRLSSLQPLIEIRRPCLEATPMLYNRGDPQKQPPRYRIRAMSLLIRLVKQVCHLWNRSLRQMHSVFAPAAGNRWRVRFLYRSHWM